MTSAKLQQEYKELYMRELSRRQELNSAVDRPIAIVTAMAGVLYFALSSLSAPANYSQVLLALVAAIVSCLLLLSITYVIRSYYGHTYAFIPTPRQLESYRANLVEYEKKYSPTADADTDQKVFEYIHEAYIDGAHQNAIINDLRSGLLHQAKTMLVCSVPLVVLLLALKLACTEGVHGWVHSLLNLSAR